jgi:hypothetical protein
MTTFTCLNIQSPDWTARGLVHAGMLADSRVTG